MDGRVRNGMCRSCGRYDPTSAPASCTRCGFERAIGDGQAPAYDRRAMIRGLWQGDIRYDLSRIAELFRGQGPPACAYLVWVTREDGTVVPLDAGEQERGNYLHRTQASAERAARDCAGRFAAAWVVTQDGIWRVRAGGRD